MREQERRFLVEGAQAVSEALEAGALESLFVVRGENDRIDRLAGEASGGGVDVFDVSERVAAHLTSAVTPQGIVGVSGFVDRPIEAAPPDLVAVLCSVRDPGNAGTILRSADAAGASAVVFAESSVDVYNPKTVRASAGSLFHLPVVREVPVADAVESLRSRGARILAATPSGDASAYDVDLAGPTAILLGNEAWGLTPDVLALADGTVRVPIRGRTESLNLAAAAALVLFEAARQRSGGAVHGPSFAAEIAAGAHDLRSPLAGLGGFARLLADRWDRLEEAKRREVISGMALDAERAAALVHLVVDAARVEVGELRASAEHGDLADPARAVARFFHAAEGYPEVVVVGGAETIMDRERLRAILLVLVEAAVRLGSEGPVTIHAEKEGGAAVIAVERRGLVGQVDPDLLLAGPAGGGSPGPYLASIVAGAVGWRLSVHAEGGIRFRLELGHDR